MQRTSHPPLRPFAVALVGLVKGLRADRQGRMESLFVDCDTRKILEDELTGSDAAFLHGRLHVGDARFDDGKSAFSCRNPRALGLNDRKLRLV